MRRRRVRKVKIAPIISDGPLRVSPRKVTKKVNELKVKPTDNIVPNKHRVVKPIKDSILINPSIVIPPKKSHRVFIIGGGPGVGKVKLADLKDEDTICVNAAVNFVPNPTYFITMDYSYFDPKRKINTVDEVIKKSQYSYFILNTNEGNSNMKVIDGEVTDVRHNFVYKDLDKFNRVIPSITTSAPNTGFGLTVNDFSNGNNSGFCAIQLAILLGYEEIYLIGYDLSTSPTETHFHQLYGTHKLGFSDKVSGYRTIIENSIKLLNKSKSKAKIISITPTTISNIKTTSLDKVQSNPIIRNSEKKYVIVSYYTVNTPYEQEAAKLRNSLERLKVPYDIVGVPNLGDWQANTRFKAKFMQDMLIKHKGKSIVWVDSDAVIHSYPSLFDTYDCDVAVRWQDFRWRKNECLSGTIYLENNSKTMELCKRWENGNIAEGPGAKTFEQWNLGKVIEEMRAEGKIRDENLPPEYTMIFDSMRAMYPNVNPVIEHFQASRKLRNTI